jgi:L-lysine 2,3-aminomutase
LFNQSVLLKGINDSVAVLATLSERLFEIGIIPYYLHMLDPVQGAAHFEVGQAQAMLIMQGLRERLPGYLVPRLVREIPGSASKIHIELITP